VKQSKLDRIFKYLEIIGLSSGLLFGFWLRVVRPAFRQIVKEELLWVNTLASEVATPEQYKTAILKFEAMKKNGEYIPARASK